MKMTNPVRSARFALSASILSLLSDFRSAPSVTRAAPTMRSKLFKKSFGYLAVVLLALALWPQASQAGNGRFKAGVYNFCVSVRFHANAAELAQIRTAFQNASQIFADATDGQQRFGTVTIVNDSGASQSADYWVNPGAGRAFATIGQYGVRGQHVNLFFDSNFQALNTADEIGRAHV